MFGLSHSAQKVLVAIGFSIGTLCAAEGFAGSLDEAALKIVFPLENPTATFNGAPWANFSDNGKTVPDIAIDEVRGAMSLSDVVDNMRSCESERAIFCLDSAITMVVPKTIGSNVFTQLSDRKVYSYAKSYGRRYGDSVCKQDYLVVETIVDHQMNDNFDIKFGFILSRDNGVEAITIAAREPSGVFVLSEALMLESGQYLKGFPFCR